MGQPVESSLQQSGFVPLLPATSRDMVMRRWESAPKSISMKRSFAAGAFLAVYLAAYIGAGFAGVALCEYAWSAIFP